MPCAGLAGVACLKQRRSQAWLVVGAGHTPMWPHTYGLPAPGNAPHLPPLTPPPAASRRLVLQSCPTPVFTAAGVTSNDGGGQDLSNLSYGACRTAGQPQQKAWTCNSATSKIDVGGGNVAWFGGAGYCRSTWTPAAPSASCPGGGVCPTPA